MPDEKTARQNAPDFREIEHWVFDLDNTLYAADTGLLRTVEDRICLFVQNELGLARDHAWDLQKDYFRKFGSTLNGLIDRHGTDPERYLSFVNDVEFGFTPDPKLRAGLERLPGKRFVFTSNCGRYAERVLEYLGVAHLFEDIFDVRRTGYVPKPNKQAYEAALRDGIVHAEGAAMFDDLVANLEFPARLGMRTVWLRTPEHRGARPDYVHHETDDLTGFLHAIEVKGEE
jgi:putative hydrolase of the HAD superfamily